MFVRFLLLFTVLENPLSPEGLMRKRAKITDINCPESAWFYIPLCLLIVVAVTLAFATPNTGVFFLILGPWVGIALTLLDAVEYPEHTNPQEMAKWLFINCVLGLSGGAALGLFLS